MKTNTFLVSSLLSLALAQHASAQGSLTPPQGAPGPVMKSLDQIEARTPLVAGQPGVAIDGNGSITISQPGSYYLTANRTYTANTTGILISSSDVTLDLNGFALINTTGDGTAISIGAANVTVRNGIIRGGTIFSAGNFTFAGWNAGVLETANHANLVAENLNVMGMRYYGISLGNAGSRVESCSTHTTGGVGIHATSVLKSTARASNVFGILSPDSPNAGMVSDCLGESVFAFGDGISATDSPVSNSAGYAVDGTGILAERASNCHGVSKTGSGIDAVTATGCSGRSTSGTGINSQIATNCYAYRPSGGAAIFTSIAIGCASFGGGTINATHKYNMP